MDQLARITVSRNGAIKILCELSPLCTSAMREQTRDQCTTADASGRESTTRRWDIPSETLPLPRTSVFQGLSFRTDAILYENDSGGKAISGYILLLAAHVGDGRWEVVYRGSESRETLEQAARTFGEAVREWWIQWVRPVTISVSVKEGSQA